MIKNKTNTIIVGGGPSGLLCQSLLKSPSLILEKNKMAGKKLLLTGGGKCNFTHLGTPEETIKHYYEGKNFVRNAVYSFPPEKIISYFAEKGISSITDNGKVFPSTLKAESVLNALIKEVNIKTGSEVKNVEKTEEGFIVKTENEEYFCRNLVLASGGVSYPETGSDGYGYSLASSLGHTVNKTYPTLAPVVLNLPLKGIRGITRNIKVTLRKKEFSGSAVFTDSGFSGPVAENISYYLGEEKEICISFLDEIPHLEGKKSLKNLLSLPENLTCSLLGNIADKKVSQLNRDEISFIRERLTKCPFKAKAGKKGAMNNRGGIPTEEINSKTMESRLIKGLYFAGDIIDISGECGGYSLTFCFSSAFLVAKAITEENHVLY